MATPRDVYIERLIARGVDPEEAARRADEGVRLGIVDANVDVDIDIDADTDVDPVGPVFAPDVEDEPADANVDIDTDTDVDADFDALLEEALDDAGSPLIEGQRQYDYSTRQDEREDLRRDVMDLAIEEYRSQGMDEDEARERADIDLRRLSVEGGERLSDEDLLRIGEEPVLSDIPRRRVIDAGDPTGRREKMDELREQFSDQVSLPSLDGFDPFTAYRDMNETLAEAARGLFVGEMEDERIPVTPEDIENRSAVRRAIETNVVPRAIFDVLNPLDRLDAEDVRDLALLAEAAGEVTDYTTESKPIGDPYGDGEQLYAAGPVADVINLYDRYFGSLTDKKIRGMAEAAGMAPEELAGLDERMAMRAERRTLAAGIENLDAVMPQLQNAENIEEAENLLSQLQLREIPDAFRLDSGRTLSAQSVLDDVAKYDIEMPESLSRLEAALNEDADEEVIEDLLSKVRYGDLPPETRQRLVSLQSLQDGIAKREDARARLGQDLEDIAIGGLETAFTTTKEADDGTLYMAETTPAKAMRLLSVPESIVTEGVVMPAVDYLGGKIFDGYEPTRDYDRTNFLGRIAANTYSGQLGLDLDLGDAYLGVPGTSPQDDAHGWLVTGGLIGSFLVPYEGLVGMPGKAAARAYKGARPVWDLYEDAPVQERAARTAEAAAAGAVSRDPIAYIAQMVEAGAKEQARRGVSPLAGMPSDVRRDAVNGLRVALGFDEKQVNDLLERTGQGNAAVAATHIDNLRRALNNESPASDSLHTSEGYQAVGQRFGEAVDNQMMSPEQAKAGMALLEVLARRTAADPNIKGIDSPAQFFERFGLEVRPDESPVVPDEGAKASGGAAPAFYSAVERTVERFLGETRKGRLQIDQLINRLEKEPGVRADEIEFMGLTDWLREVQRRPDNKGFVDGQELRDYIDRNALELEYVTLGETPKARAALDAYTKHLNEVHEPAKQRKRDAHVELIEAIGIDGPFVSPQTQRGETIATIQRANGQAVTGQPGQLMFEYFPAGRTRRAEVGEFITADELTKRLRGRTDDVLGDAVDPSKFIEAAQAAFESQARVNELFDNLEGAQSPSYEGYELPGSEGVYREILVYGKRRGDTRDDGSQRLLAGVYQAPHFGDKGDALLFHLRLNDRKGPDGERVLFVEEVQSDLMTAARRRGMRAADGTFDPVGRVIQMAKRDKYQLVDDGQQGTYIAKQLDGQLYEVQGTRQPPMSGTQSGMPKGQYLSWRAFIQGTKKYREAAQVLPMPYAPLRPRWHETALKTVLREAAVENYDAIAWTTGVQQAERWQQGGRLSRLKWEVYNYVDDISLTPVVHVYDDGTIEVTVDVEMPRNMDDVRLTGELRNGDELAIDEAGEDRDGIKPATVDKHVSKEVSKRLLEGLNRLQARVYEIAGEIEKTLSGRYTLDELSPESRLSYAEANGIKVPRAATVRDGRIMDYFDDIDDAQYIVEERYFDVDGVEAIELDTEDRADLLDEYWEVVPRLYGVVHNPQFELRHRDAGSGEVYSTRREAEEGLRTEVEYEDYTLDSDELEALATVELPEDAPPELIKGFASLYDRAMPKWLKKHSKRHGTRPRTVEMDFDGEADTVHYLTLTDSMRQSALAGAALFQRGKKGKARGSFERRLKDPKGKVTTAELMDELKRINLVTSKRLLEVLGDQPKHLEPILNFMLEQREKVLKGTLTPRDVVKAYVMTVASQGSGAIRVSTLTKKTGLVPDPLFSYEKKRRKERGRGIRPEEAVAAWLMSDEGKKALNEIDAGTYNRESWEPLAKIRAAFGDDRITNLGLLGEGTGKTLEDIAEITAQMNAAGGDYKQLNKIVQSLSGIANVKGPFLLHLLGFGNAVTLDAREVNFWLTGKGRIGQQTGRKAALARHLKKHLTSSTLHAELSRRIEQRLQRLRRQHGIGQDIDNDAFNHIMHQWIWDNSVGRATTQAGMMKAMLVASPEDALRGTGAVQERLDLGYAHGLSLPADQRQQMVESQSFFVPDDASYFVEARGKVFVLVSRADGQEVGRYSSMAEAVDAGAERSVKEGLLGRPAPHATDSSPVRVGPLVQGQTIHEANRAIQHAEVEYLAAWSEGRPLLRSRGTKHAVDPTTEEWNRMRRARGVEATHNHPGNKIFSAADVITALAVGMRRFNATNLNGRVWTLTLPDRPDLTSSLADARGLYDRVNPRHPTNADLEAIARDLHDMDIATRDAAFEIIKKQEQARGKPLSYDEKWEILNVRRQAGYQAVLDRRVRGSTIQASAPRRDPYGLVASVGRRGAQVRQAAAGVGGPARQRPGVPSESRRYGARGPQRAGPDQGAVGQQLSFLSGNPDTRVQVLTVELAKTIDVALPETSIEVPDTEPPIRGPADPFGFSASASRIYELAQSDDPLVRTQLEELLLGLPADVAAEGRRAVQVADAEKRIERAIDPAALSTASWNLVSLYGYRVAQSLFRIVGEPPYGSASDVWKTSVPDWVEDHWEYVDDYGETVSSGATLTEALTDLLGRAGYAGYDGKSVIQDIAAEDYFDPDWRPVEDIAAEFSGMGTWLANPQPMLARIDAAIKLATSRPSQTGTKAEIAIKHSVIAQLEAVKQRMYEEWISRDGVVRSPEDPFELSEVEQQADSLARLLLHTDEGHVAQGRELLSMMSDAVQRAVYETVYETKLAGQLRADIKEVTEYIADLEDRDVDDVGVMYAVVLGEYYAGSLSDRVKVTPGQLSRIEAAELSDALHEFIGELEYTAEQFGEDGWQDYEENRTSLSDAQQFYDLAAEAYRLDADIKGTPTPPLAEVGETLAKLLSQGEMDYHPYFPEDYEYSFRPDYEPDEDYPERVIRVGLHAEEIEKLAGSGVDVAKLQALHDLLNSTDETTRTQGEELAKLLPAAQPYLDRLTFVVDADSYGYPPEWLTLVDYNLAIYHPEWTISIGDAGADERIVVTVYPRPNRGPAAAAPISSPADPFMGEKMAELVKSGPEGLKQARELAQALGIPLDLSGADLSDADLYGADLSGINFSGANFSGAELMEADLSGADLSDVDFSRGKHHPADLFLTILSNANLSGANLSQALLTGVDLDGIYYDGTTRWPDGFTPPESAPEPPTVSSPADPFAADFAAELAQRTVADPAQRELYAENFRQWWRQSAVVDADGDPLQVYHGTSRADRIEGPSRFMKERATSGPMSFFTTDPEIASSYTSKSDNSLDFDGVSYDEHFTIRGKSGRKGWRFAWWALPVQMRNYIVSEGFRVAQDPMSGEFVFEADSPSGQISKSHWQYKLREHRGNGFAALWDTWWGDGYLAPGDEGDFLDVLQLLGIKDATFNDPEATRGGVFPVYLSIQNPLRTDAVPAEVVDALDAASREPSAQPSLAEGFGADFWDKRTMDPEEWVRLLRKDLDDGVNSLVWTRIPDWVTETLQGLGYDGIQDLGGKQGGTPHTVWIPFEEPQVKSVFNQGRWSRDDGNIIRSPDDPFMREKLVELIKAGQAVQAVELTRALGVPLDLSGVDFSDANLSGSNLSGAILSGARLEDVNLRNADLSGADLRSAEINNADTQGANLSGVDLRDSRLDFQDFRDADLTDADFSGAKIERTSTEGAVLKGARFTYAVGRAAFFEDSDLTGADLSNADFRFEPSRGFLARNSFEGSNLSNAKMFGADLRAVIFDRTDLTGADLRNADLRGATFRGATGLDSAQLDGIYYDGEDPNTGRVVVWPDGFEPPESASGPAATRPLISEPEDPFLERVFRKQDYDLVTVNAKEAREFLEQPGIHYAGGAGKVGTYIFGLRDKAGKLVGVSWWNPPGGGSNVKNWAARQFKDRRGNPVHPDEVINLSRLALSPDVPKRGGASYLLQRSMKQIKADSRQRRKAGLRPYRVALTYADKREGHTGYIYAMTGWKYTGLSSAEAKFIEPSTGRQVSRQSGKNRRTSDMLAAGYKRLTPERKHRYVLELDNSVEFVGNRVKLPAELSQIQSRVDAGLIRSPDDPFREAQAVARLEQHRTAIEHLRGLHEFLSHEDPAQRAYGHEILQTIAPQLAGRLPVEFGQRVAQLSIANLQRLLSNKPMVRGHAKRGRFDALSYLPEPEVMKGPGALDAAVKGLEAMRYEALTNSRVLSFGNIYRNYTDSVLPRLQAIRELYQGRHTPPLTVEALAPAVEQQLQLAGLADQLDFSTAERESEYLVFGRPVVRIELVGQAREDAALRSRIIAAVAPSIKVGRAYPIDRGEAGVSEALTFVMRDGPRERITDEGTLNWLTNRAAKGLIRDADDPFAIDFYGTGTQLDLLTAPTQEAKGDKPSVRRRRRGPSAIVRARQVNLPLPPAKTVRDFAGRLTTPARLTFPVGSGVGGGFNVLSLFDGISTARQAMHNIGLPVSRYIAAEIDRSAIAVTKDRWPNTEHVGDVQALTPETVGLVDILVGGSPCQDLRPGRKGLKGSKSKLFWEYARLFEEASPRFFLFENTAHISNKDARTVSRVFGVDPIPLDSALVSGQTRKRYFWTNIPGIRQPDQLGIKMPDVILTLSQAQALGYDQIGPPLKASTIAGLAKQVGETPEMTRFKRYHFRIGEKSRTLKAAMGKRGGDTMLQDGTYRRIARVEAERLQGLPDGYTSAASQGQALKGIGNAFTVQVIEHILSHLATGDIDRGIYRGGLIRSPADPFMREKLVDLVMAGRAVQAVELTRTLGVRLDLSGADLDGADLSGIDLRDVDLDNAILFGANLNGADLSGVDLRTVSLEGANLSGADLRGADLRDVSLGGTDLSDANLRGANLTGTRLIAANLTGTDLSGFDLSGANLREANLSGANLSGADLSGADLRRTNLTDTDLRNANLSNVKFEYVILPGITTYAADAATSPLRFGTPRLDLLEGIYYDSGTLFYGTFGFPASAPEPPARPSTVSSPADPFMGQRLVELLSSADPAVRAQGTELLAMMPNLSAVVEDALAAQLFRLDLLEQLQLGEASPLDQRFGDAISMLAFDLNMLYNGAGPGGLPHRGQEALRGLQRALPELLNISEQVFAANTAFIKAQPKGAAYLGSLTNLVRLMELDGRARQVLATLSGEQPADATTIAGWMHTISAKERYSEPLANVHILVDPEQNPVLVAHEYAKQFPMNAGQIRVERLSGSLDADLIINADVQPQVHDLSLIRSPADPFQLPLLDVPSVGQTRSARRRRSAAVMAQTAAAQTRQVPLPLGPAQPKAAPAPTTPKPKAKPAKPFSIKKAGPKNVPPVIRGWAVEQWQETLASKPAAKWTASKIKRLSKRLLVAHKPLKGLKQAQLRAEAERIATASLERHLKYSRKPGTFEPADVVYGPNSDEAASNAMMPAFAAYEQAVMRRGATPAVLRSEVKKLAKALGVNLTQRLRAQRWTHEKVLQPNGKTKAIPRAYVIWQRDSDSQLGSAVYQTRKEIEDLLKKKTAAERKNLKPTPRPGVLEELSADELDLLARDVAYSSMRVDSYAGVPEPMTVPAGGTRYSSVLAWWEKSTAKAPPSLRNVRGLLRKLGLKESSAEVAAAAPAKHRGKKLKEMPAAALATVGRKLLDGYKRAEQALKVSSETTRANAAESFANVDAIKARTNGMALRDPAVWNQAMAEATGIDRVLDAPVRAMELVENPQKIVNIHKGLSAGQRRDVVAGMRISDEFAKAYANKQVSPTESVLLLLWGSLSKRLSPYPHEAGFLDAVVDGVVPHIEAAIEGNFDLKAYERWAKKTTDSMSRRGSPGVNTKSNLNDFGRGMLQKMSAEYAPGVTFLQHFHNLLGSDLSGTEVRRRFFSEMPEKVGINAKVLSFVLLVAGKRDLLVLDRVQIRHLFGGDAKAEQYGTPNPYEAWSPPADPLERDPASWGTWSGSSGPGTFVADARGLLIYELMEDSLAEAIDQLKTLGLLEGDYSLGQFHWESWVYESAQEVSHGTLEAILKLAAGQKDPFIGASVREGKYDNMQSGFEYQVTDAAGTRVWVVETSDGAKIEMNRAALDGYLKRVKSYLGKISRKTGKKFNVSESTTQPWYKQPEVDRAELDKFLREQLTDTSKGKQARLRPDSASQAAVQDADADRPGGLPGGVVSSPDDPFLKDKLVELIEAGPEGIAQAVELTRMLGVPLDLSDRTLNGADLSGVDFSGAILRETFFWDANLSDANLSGADLRGADFNGADLSGADLSGADCRDADFELADLYLADLSGSNLSGANFNRAGFGATNLDGIYYDDTTVWPRDRSGSQFGPPESAPEPPARPSTISSPDDPFLIDRLADQLEVALVSGDPQRISKIESDLDDVSASVRAAVQERVPYYRPDPTARVPELQASAQEIMQAGTTDQERRQRHSGLVGDFKPVYPYENVPEPATKQNMAAALRPGQVPKLVKEGALPPLSAGQLAALRLDIPAYKDNNTWVVTIHEAKSTGDMSGGAIAYDSVGAVTDARLIVRATPALRIAAGSNKGTIARIVGKFVPMTPAQAKARADAALNDPEWIQVGMDPERHSFFYDRKTRRPVMSADEVIQIGPLVLAKGAKYATKAEEAKLKYQRDETTGALRGQFQRADMDYVITLFKTADFGTFLHEAGHLIEELMPAELMASMATLFDSKNGRLSKVGSEQLADAFMWYLRTSKAIDGRVWSVLRRLELLMRELWLAVKRQRPLLPKEVVEQWDNWLRPDLALDSEVVEVTERAGQALIPKVTLSDKGRIDDSIRAALIKESREARAQQIPWRRDELLQQTRLKPGETVDVNEALARVLGAVAAERVRRSMGSTGLRDEAPVVMTTRSVVPAARARSIAKEAKRRMLEALQLSAREMSALLKSATGDSIQLSRTQQAGLRSLASQVAAEPMGRSVALRLLDPNADLSSVSLAEINSLQEALIDTIAGPAAGRSFKAESVPPTMGFAVARSLAKLPAAISPQLEKLREKLSETFVVSQPLEGKVNPAIVELVDARIRELGQIDDWVRGEARRAKRGGAADLREILSGLKEQLTAPVDVVALDSLSNLLGFFSGRRKVAMIGDVLDASQIDGIESVLRHGPGLSSLESAAVTVLRSYLDAPQSELSDADQRLLTEAIGTVYDGIRRRAHLVEQRGRDIATCLLGSENSAVVRGLDKPALRELYRAFYEGHWAADDVVGNKPTLESFAANNGLVDYSLDYALVEMIVRLRAREVLSGMAADLARHDLLLDDEAINAMAPETARDDRSVKEFRDQVRHYLNALLTRPERVFDEAGNLVDNLDVPTPGTSAHAYDAYTTAKEILARYGISPQGGIQWQSKVLPDGTRALMPRNVSAQLDAALKSNAPIGELAKLPGNVLAEAVDAALNVLFSGDRLLKQGMTTGNLVPNAPYYTACFIGMLAQIHQGMGAVGGARVLGTDPGMAAQVAKRLYGTGHRVGKGRALITSDGRVYTADMIADLAKRYGLDSSQAQSESAIPLLQDIKRLHATGFRKFASYLRTWQEILIEAATAVDNYFRVQLFVDQLKQGRSPDAAAEHARRIGYDYNAMTAFEKKVLRYAVLFYSFIKINLVFLLDTLARNPSRFMGQVRLLRGLQREHTEEDPQIIFPDWANSRLAVGYRNAEPHRDLYLQTVDTASTDGYVRLLPAIGAPDGFGLLLDIYDAAASGLTDQQSVHSLIQNVHPVAQAFIAGAYGIDPFTGRGVESGNEVPLMVSHLDEELLDGLLMRQFGAQLKRNRYGQLRYHVDTQRGATSWYMLNNLGAIVPGLGRSMDTLTQFDRVDLGMLEALARAVGKPREPMLEGPRPGMSRAEEVGTLMGVKTSPVPTLGEEQDRLMRDEIRRLIEERKRLDRGREY